MVAWAVVLTGPGAILIGQGHVVAAVGAVRFGSGFCGVAWCEGSREGSYAHDGALQRR